VINVREIMVQAVLCTNNRIVIFLLSYDLTRVSRSGLWKSNRTVCNGTACQFWCTYRHC